MGHYLKVVFGYEKISVLSFLVSCGFCFSVFAQSEFVPPVYPIGDHLCSQSFGEVGKIDCLEVKSHELVFDELLNAEGTEDHILNGITGLSVFLPEFNFDFVQLLDDEATLDYTKPIKRSVTKFVSLEVFFEQIEMNSFNVQVILKVQHPLLQVGNEPVIESFAILAVEQKSPEGVYIALRDLREEIYTYNQGLYFPDQSE